MSTALKQLAHFAPPPQITQHPSVFVCTPRDPWHEGKFLPGKTMVHHQSVTSLGGGNYKCASCQRTIGSQ